MNDMCNNGGKNDREKKCCISYYMKLIFLLFKYRKILFFIKGGLIWMGNDYSHYLNYYWHYHP